MANLFTVSKANLPEILILDEVAQYLRVNKQTVYRLVKTGRLPAFKAGRALRFHYADVERYVTYKYTCFGTLGVRPFFYKAAVLDRYFQDSKKYYIMDEAFGGKLGLKEHYYGWKEGKLAQDKAFVEVHYQKVRWNMAHPSEPVRWELLVILSSAENRKLSRGGAEQFHWSKYFVHLPRLPEVKRTEDRTP